MEGSSLLSDNGSRSGASDGESSLAVLGPGTLDFRGRFIQTMLQHHYNWAILDSAQLSYVLNRLRNFTKCDYLILSSLY
ncbi:hypothetical protein GJ744_005683 [Endocarpon pusillum]|uniref:Uncharacterized protein n=1 Tax=Endocarpon pusillum TaxID=364733 RepID=A0A8H7DZG5_9EURO|nr:hypothetical protein GJ744_005683 [Endocarpon pusillum]